MSEERDRLVRARAEADKALQVYDINVIIHQDLSEIPAVSLARIIKACEVELMERDDAWTELDAENGEGQE